MKKAFTLVEIIISITLIVIIGTIGIITLLKPNNKTTEYTKSEKIVLDAANVYLNVSGDNLKQIYSGSNGIIIKLDELLNQGLITDKIISKINEESNIELKTNEEFILAVFGSIEDDECSGINYYFSWKLNNTQTIKLCTSGFAENLLDDGTNYFVFLKEKKGLDHYYLISSNLYYDENFINEVEHTLLGGVKHYKLKYGFKYYHKINSENQFVNTKKYNEEKNFIYISKKDIENKSIENKIIKDYDLNDYVDTSRNSNLATSAYNRLGSLGNTKKAENNIFYITGITEKNYVYFAGYLWKILKLNTSNGNVKIVLDGDIGSSAYGNINFAESDVYSKLNQWYNNNLSAYESYINTNAEFCVNTNYSATKKRLETGIPNNTCENVIQSKIGLLTVDDIVFAGGSFNNPTQENNQKYYLAYNKAYWTMTPYDSNSMYLSNIETLNHQYLPMAGSAFGDYKNTSINYYYPLYNYLTYVNSNKYESNSPLNNIYGNTGNEIKIRPVIELKSILISNNDLGTDANPYKIN